jgi:hypothetical protein
MKYILAPTVFAVSVLVSYISASFGYWLGTGTEIHDMLIVAPAVFAAYSFAFMHSFDLTAFSSSLGWITAGFAISKIAVTDPPAISLWIVLSALVILSLPWIITSMLKIQEPSEDEKRGYYVVAQIILAIPWLVIMWSYVKTLGN